MLLMKLWTMHLHCQLFLPDQLTSNKHTFGPRGEGQTLVWNFPLFFDGFTYELLLLKHMEHG